MQTEINGNKLELMVGDITKQATDAIVNAANGSLLGGGGVDGAIHRAAGKELLEECRKIRKEELSGDELPTGQAVITQAYRLPAKYVIHTVGPVWQENRSDAEELLADCYWNSLELALDRGLSSISFPSISTGVYRFPVEMAAATALRTIVEFLSLHSFGKVVMTLFSDHDYKVYEKALQRILENEEPAV